MLVQTDEHAVVISVLLSGQQREPDARVCAPVHSAQPCRHCEPAPLEAKVLGGANAPNAVAAASTAYHRHVDATQFRDVGLHRRVRRGLLHKERRRTVHPSKGEIMRSWQPVPRVLALQRVGIGPVQLVVCVLLVVDATPCARQELVRLERGSVCQPLVEDLLVLVDGAVSTPALDDAVG